MLGDDARLSATTCTRALPERNEAAQSSVDGAPAVHPRHQGGVTVAVAADCSVREGTEFRTAGSFVCHVGIWRLALPATSDER